MRNVNVSVPDQCLSKYFMFQNYEVNEKGDISHLKRSIECLSNKFLVSFKFVFSQHPAEHLASV